MSKLTEEIFDLLKEAIPKLVTMKDTHNLAGRLARGLLVFAKTVFQNNVYKRLTDIDRAIYHLEEPAPKLGSPEAHCLSCGKKRILLYL